MYLVRNEKLILTLCTSLFVLSIALLTFFDKLIVLVPLCLFIFMDFALKNFAKARVELRIVYYLLILFIVIEQSYGLDNSYDYIKSLLGDIQKISLLFALVFVILKNKVSGTREIKTLTFIMIGFITLNLVSTMLNYQSINIFINSTLDYCKYFTLIYIMILSKFNDEEILKLLKLYSPFIVVGTFFAVFQFMGVEKFFDLFRGTYDIQIRSSFNRAIGFFPHPIEFGNYSCVLFCLYYFLNKYKYKNKWLAFISILLFMNVLLTFTRVALVALILILILNSMKSVLQAIRTFFVLFVLLIILNNFIDLQGIIDDTKTEYSGMSPREYYILKGIEVWKHYPLLGIGFNTYGTKYYRELTGDKIFNQFNIHGFDRMNLSTTDTFLAQILPEFGAIGILLIMLFCIFIYRRYKYLNKIDKSNKAYIYVIISCLLLSLNSSSVLFNPHVGAFFWISIGMIINNYIIVIKKRRTA